jgi:hypothetical protein
MLLSIIFILSKKYICRFNSKQYKREKGRARWKYLKIVKETKERERER